jgi:hypothetical protein
MSAGISTGRELKRLSRRFVSETCAFLSDNWYVERRWWPLRHECAGGTAVSACDATAGSPRVTVQTVGPDDLEVVHFVSTASEAVAAEVSATYLFVVVPFTGTPLPEAPVRAAAAQDPPEEEEQWPIWVPETIAPSRVAPARRSGCRSR